MPHYLTISLGPETLSTGLPEEQATFGLLAITANNHLLTGGEDTESRQLRHGPYVPGYPLAEWFAWNWWRIRWELGRPSEDEAGSRWDFAHRMPAIGEGYAWPNITVFSDGIRSFLDSEPSGNPEGVLFRYFGAPRRETVPAAELEIAVDGFVEDILSHLDRRELRATNLHRLWAELTEERENAEIARFRRLEAQLGCDPDEASEEAIQLRLLDAGALGDEALSEVAADTAFRGLNPDSMISAEDIAEIAESSGFDSTPDHAVSLSDPSDLPQAGAVAAWRLGEQAARLVRDQEKLDGQPVADKMLSNFAGTTPNAVSDTYRHSKEISFALDRDDRYARLSLRSRWETGRRFELARLVGDRILANQSGPPTERLFPATRTYSYRQKMQRAFAAELLCPFASVDEMLSGDYSEDKQNDVAEHFSVSPMTIRTQLRNKRRIDEEEALDIVGRGAVS